MELRRLKALRGALVATLALAALAAVLMAASPAAAATVTAEVTTLEARYGPETWKDESATVPGIAQGFPATIPGASGPYQNPYSDPFRRHGGPGASGFYMGQSLVAEVTLNVTDATAQDAGAAYLVNVTLATPWGDVPSKVTRTSPTTFLAQLDLDGEPGKPWPNLLAPGRAGTHDLHITVRQAASGPLGREVEIGSTVVPVATGPADLLLTGTPYPQGSIPGYADLGAPNNLTRLHLPPVAPTGLVNASITCPIPHAPAVVSLWNAATSFVVFNGTTNDTGVASFSFEPSVLTGAGAGLLVLEGHLTGANGTLAGAHAVIPVSPKAPRVVEMGPSGGRVPQASSALLYYRIRDPGVGPQNASFRGNLVLVADGDVLATAELAPPDPEAPEYRAAYVQASAVAARTGLTRYDAYVFLLDNQNRFQALAHATRGFLVEPEPLTGYPGERSVLRLRVTNLNDNYDGVPGEPGLALTLRGELTDIPGGPVAFEATVPEGNTSTVEAFFIAPSAGAYDAALNLTADELRARKALPLEVPDRPGLLDELAARIPGPDPLAALAVVGLTAAAWARRRAA